MSGRGLILAAPTSGCGKTLVTLGLLRAFAQDGIAVRAAKSGPDYIDPQFHQTACGQPSLTLDAWAMSPDRLAALAQGPGTLIVEGAMGLFDGAPPDGNGAVADLARILRLPVVLIVDVSHQAGSVAALVSGFANFDADVEVAGVILNKVGSLRHERMLKAALRPLGIPVFGAIPREASLSLPSRHLGLVQAEEHSDLEGFLTSAADLVSANTDLAAILDVTRPLPDAPSPSQGCPLPPPGQRIAIARDLAFRFSYPHMLEDWRASGASLSFFSPLADEAPSPEADFVFLPGGYPELHAGRIASASNFLSGLRYAKAIYGECGGFMVLGEAIVDSEGQHHAMAGILPLVTSFEARKLHLGYRKLQPLGGPWAGAMNGHEFHYSTILKCEGPPLFAARDAENNDIGTLGVSIGGVSGSYAHVIDQADWTQE